MKSRHCKVGVVHLGRPQLARVRRHQDYQRAAGLFCMSSFRACDIVCLSSARSTVASCAFQGHSVQPAVSSMYIRAAMTTHGHRNGHVANAAALSSSQYTKGIWHGFCADEREYDNATVVKSILFRSLFIRRGGLHWWVDHYVRDGDHEVIVRTDKNSNDMEVV